MRPVAGSTVSRRQPSDARDCPRPQPRSRCASRTRPSGCPIRRVGAASVAVGEQWHRCRGAAPDRARAGRPRREHEGARDRAATSASTGRSGACPPSRRRTGRSDPRPAATSAPGRSVSTPVSGSRTNDRGRRSPFASRRRATVGHPTAAGVVPAAGAPPTRREGRLGREATDLRLGSGDGGGGFRRVGPRPQRPCEADDPGVPPGPGAWRPDSGRARGAAAGRLAVGINRPAAEQLVAQPAREDRRVVSGHG